MATTFTAYEVGETRPEEVAEGPATHVVLAERERDVRRGAEVRDVPGQVGGERVLDRVELQVLPAPHDGKHLQEVAPAPVHVVAEPLIRCGRPRRLQAPRVLVQPAGRDLHEPETAGCVAGHLGREVVDRPPVRRVAAGHLGRYPSPVPAQQPPQGHAERLCLEVPEGDVDRRERPHEDAALPDQQVGAVDPVPEPLRVARILTDEEGRDAPVDDRGDGSVAAHPEPDAGQAPLGRHLDDDVLA
jgi:hypothetical protein